MKCPKCKTVIPRARPILRPSERKLPATLQLFADAIGVDAALAIARECGGETRYFPSRTFLEKGHPSWLVDLIGREKAIALSDHINVLGGQHFAVPRGPTRGPAVRYFEVKEARDRGCSANEIARLLQMRRRTVFLYLAAIREEEAETRRRIGGDDDQEKGREQ